jgi:alpha-ribazole phosphatase/probable phosphoglycerate mutase
MWAAVETPGGWEHIYTSPLVRCSAFAQALAARLDVPCQRDERLAEVDYGGWEGMSPDELKQADKEILLRFYRDPARYRAADAEPLERFRNRVMEVIDEIRVRHQGQRVLVVTHAGVVRAVITHLLDAPVTSLYRITVPNASLARVRCNAERPPTLVFHGRQSL